MRQGTMDDGEGTSLQALQTPQQQRSQSTQESQEQQNTLITSIAPQTADPLGVVDSNLMSGVGQQYLPSGNDEMDENRGDTIIHDGQFTLNSQVPEQHYLGLISWTNGSFL